MELACVIHDPVTTTDELIPSGETSSYRSNPLKLATFALSRRDPQYVARANADAASKPPVRRYVRRGAAACDRRARQGRTAVKALRLGSVIFANKPGDGSAREQAASCQRVLGGCANICYEFATKRYRSNCINWGMMPFTIDEDVKFDFDRATTSSCPMFRCRRSGSRYVAAMVIHSGAAQVPHAAPCRS